MNKVLIVSNHDRTRSNGFKLDKFRFKKDIGRNWFTTNKVVDEWNKLGRNAINVSTIESFKKRLDAFMDKDNLWN